MKTSILMRRSVMDTTLHAQNADVNTNNAERTGELLKAENASLKKRLEQIESKLGRQ